eukprot:1915987-Amphidinium_carterae.1
MHGGEEGLLGQTLKPSAQLREMLLLVEDRRPIENPAHHRHTIDNPVIVNLLAKLNATVCPCDDHANVCSPKRSYMMKTNLGSMYSMKIHVGYQDQGNHNFGHGTSYKTKLLPKAKPSASNTPDS